MELRLLLAYALIVMMVVPLMTFVAWKRLNTRERKYQRRVLRERLIDAQRGDFKAK